MNTTRSEEMSFTTIASTPFDAAERLRYSRHIMLPEIGEEGQQRLKQGSVLLIGAGGLGSPAALYLAAAGVGHIGLIDPDTVDDSNLQRQVLYGTDDHGVDKTKAAYKRLSDLNPHIEISTWTEHFSPENGMQVAQDFDIILDGADNFSARYLSNDVAVLLGKPNVHGSIYRFEGQATVLNGGEGTTKGPCYRCMYPDPPEAGTVPSCGEIGVLGVLPGIIGTLQATEAIKLLLGIGEPLIGRLLLYDALSMRFRELRVPRDPHCPICGDNPQISDLADYDYPNLCIAGTDPSTNKRGNSMSIPEITVEELAQMRKENVPHTLIDVREQNEYDFANIGGTLIPLGQVQSRMDEIPAEGEVILQCRSGGRSGQAATILMAAGRTNVKNLVGGILAWSDKVDPSVPKY